MKLKFICFVGFSLFTIIGYSQSKKPVLIDSISRLIEASNASEFSENQKFHFAQQANQLAKGIDNDSIFLKTNRNVALYYYINEDFDSYISVNHRILKLSKKLKDSLPLARANFGLGSVYQIVKNVNDSAYFYYLESIKIFDKINNKTELSFSLGNLSAIQFEAKDYYGADENTIRALNILEGVEETNSILDQKWILYTRLGNIADVLLDKEKAIEYHYEALSTAKKMEDDFNNGLYSLNNIAFAKREQGYYSEAEKMFDEIANEKHLFEDDPSFYALILENLAYTKFLNSSYDKKNIISLFEKSYRISDSINDKVTKVGTVISMAKFYKALNNNKEAILYASEAYQLAKKVQNFDILLESMMILSELKDGTEGKKYLNEHIKLTDSLLHVERNVRNKYARIELETDQLEAENEQISKENLYLIILSIGLLLTGVLVYVVISQRAKNKELRLVQMQQKANEDIYNLLLVQQDKVEEARTQEKIRVSQELHDGVLGRLFGTRLSLDSLNFSDGKDAMLSRANYISQLKTIEEDIRKISHDMNTDFVSGSGFIDIVSELIENQAKAYGLKYDFNYTDDFSWELVDNKTKINIYRIIQESLQNIYKHAEAKHVKISIYRQKNVFCLDIEDNGKGFDSSKSKKGIGLKNMISRIDDIGGKIDFISQLNKGTTVSLKIPYNI